MRLPPDVSPAGARDEELVARAQAGDEDAFAILKSRYERRVIGTIKRKLWRPEEDTEIEDLLQDIFLKVHRALPGFRGESSFSTWLFQITFHECSSFIRMKQGRPSINTSALSEEQMKQFEKYFENHPIQDERAYREQAEPIIEITMKGLSGEEFIVFRDYLLNDKRQEIAKNRGIPLSRVDAILNRIKKKCRELKKIDLSKRKR